MALAFLRRHKWWFNWFLVAIIVSFIFIYIPAFDEDSAATGEVVAKVGDLPISSEEFRRTWLRQRQMYERMYQGMDPAMLRRLGLEEQALEGLVSDRVVKLEAARLGLVVDDETIARKLRTSPEFQENGQYIGGPEIKRRLEQQGMKESEFIELLRAQLLRERLQALVTDVVTVTPREAEQEYRRRNEKVKAEYVLVDAARFQAQATVSDADVKARFDAKKDAYRIPERRVVSYVLIQPEGLASRVAVTDQDIDRYYAENKDEFTEGEQACVSHVLIKVKQPDSAEGHTEDEARRIAQGALDQLKAGADFATVAKASSEDEGSAPSGGDLGCFGPGRMMPDFERAAFDLAPQQTSGLVKTSYGYHIIRANSSRPETVTPLPQVKERLRAQLLQQRTSAMADDQASTMRAAIARGRSLEEASRERGLSVLKSPPMAKGEPVPPLVSPTLVARAFALKQGETAAESFPVGSGTAFIALGEIQPAHTPELKDVQDRVRADIVKERTFEQARTMAADLRTRAQQDGLDKAAAALGLARKETPAPVGREEAFGDLGTSAALDAAYALESGAVSEPLRVPAGYAVVRVLEKTPFDAAAFAKEQGSLVESLREQRKAQLFQAYLTQARERFTIQRYPEAMQRIVG